MEQSAQRVFPFVGTDPVTIIIRSEEELIEQALLALMRRHRKGEVLNSPTATQNFLRLRLAHAPNEVFGCIYLDTRNAIIEIEDLFNGTVDGASVYPRVVVQKALLHNAAALICYHNHPSGDPTPSRADEVLTRRLRDALGLVDIRLIDHFVIGVGECVSFAERGLV